MMASASAVGPAYNLHLLLGIDYFDVHLIEDHHHVIELVRRDPSLPVMASFTSSMSGSPFLAGRDQRFKSF